MSIQMIDIKLKYQATIFVNAEDIIPSPDIINSLMETFRDKALIPNTFQQIGPSASAPTVRLRLSTSDNEWVISFATHRIDIDRNPTNPKGSNLGEISDFCLNATELFERILKKYTKRANRLGLNNNSLLQEMTPSQLDNVHSKLFISPQFYKDNPSFEWNWRSVAQYPIEISSLMDKLNVVTVIKRVRGEITAGSGVSEFDRIQFSLDINTTDLNNDYRFELAHIKDYFPKASELHNKLSTDIQEYINA